MRKKEIDGRLKEMYIAIGKNVFRLRGKMSQDALGKKAKVSRGTVAAIEEGQSVNMRTLIKIADALGVKPADLFITDGDLDRVSYLHILLMNRLAKSLGIEPGKKDGK